jgi:tetratricopeptide (TPR) repeat protein
MLRTLPGWSLALADNHGFLFVRGNATLETASAEFENPHDRAIYLAQAAIIQQSAGNPEIARPLLLDALKTDPKNPHVLVRSALFAAQEGRWRDTRDEAEAALALDPSLIQADHLLALALFKSGAISKAAARIEALAAKLPQDPTILSLQARIARENNDPATEIEALEKLLQLAKFQDSPTGQIHALLGQTWARRGFPDQALTHLQSALDSAPPPDQRESLQENIDLIRQRTR